MVGDAKDEDASGPQNPRPPQPKTAENPNPDQKKTSRPRRYQTNYFAPFPGYYFSGDGARRDADGYYWITGRVDDVINVSGHR